MNVVVAPPYDSTVIKTLFQYYQGTQLDRRSSYDQCAEEAKKFLYRNRSSRKKLTQIITGMTYDEAMFSFPSDWSVEMKHDLSESFLNFYRATYNLITKREPQFRNLRPVKRNPLPSLEAFEYNDWKISKEPPNYLLCYGN